jgi:hypothetical protein
LLPHTADPRHSLIAFGAILPDQKHTSSILFFHMARAFYSRFGISVRREFPDNGSCYKDWRSAKPCAWLISNTASPSLTPRAPTERQSASSRE